MKALQLKEYNHQEIIDAPKPSPKAGEVLIKVKACGICGSDIHGLDGSTGRRIPPLIMGHEASGVIEELGPGVKGYAKGDRVTFDSTLFCGECRYCREGNFNFCENRQVLGVACDEYHRDGAFAEYVVVPAIVLYPMPDEVSFVQAAMIEPLAVAVHGVSITPITIGDTALLMGAGIIGLLTLQVLRTAGCGRIYVADVDEGRLKQAMDFGATGTFNPKKDDIPAEMKKLTGGLGAQIALDAVGMESTVHACLYSVRKGGNVTAIGNLAPEIKLPPAAYSLPPDYPEGFQRLFRGVCLVSPADPERTRRCGFADFQGSTSGRRGRLFHTALQSGSRTHEGYSGTLNQTQQGERGL
ncbi:galactitol-1-phosphate 5-dehydrogenase [Marispirochaeta aestuarii]|uniref:zinc-dependent alcohol dehydrogenase n=1 Tax=Marispirochaeta aestuarii TaxID=1963862 RepID=UPI0029C71662|nr:galactitol-1-phosphate 5-dehydrogenase [Marispirochaeta aestuarii]